MSTRSPKSPSKRRRYFAAVVLGTALSATGSAVSATSAAEPVCAVKDISRYCTTCWRNARLPPDAWSDCTQEVFSRLLERVAPEDWGELLAEETEQRREFLRAIDAVKKRSQRSRKWYSSTADFADRTEAQERRLADDREVIGRLSSECLGRRQQRILQMSFEGWSVREIASQMAMSAARVSDEKYKAICKLREHLHEF
jgi:RNA polymerase sigma factor (sigma-70 family)